MKRPRLLTALTAAAMTLALASGTPSFAQTGTQTYQPPMQGRTPHDPGDRQRGPHGGQYRTSGRTGTQNPWAGQGPAGGQGATPPATRGHSQLVVNGVELYESEENYQKYIKFLTVPKERHLSDLLTFRFGSVNDIRKLEDPLRRQIYEAMDRSRVAKSEFATLGDAQDNFTMRVEAIELMRKIVTRKVDFDFWHPAYDDKPAVPPTANPDYWDTVDNDGGVGGKMFCSRSDRTAYDAVIHITDAPFRGDCMATLEICFFYGAARAIGADEFKNVHPKGIYGLGIPYSNDKKLSINLNRSQGYTENLTVDNMIPGDCVYMQNKDDYKKYCPQGYWRGENTLYMGKFDTIRQGHPQYSLTGTPRFSGLGLWTKKEAENKIILFLSEGEIKTELKKAYNEQTAPQKDDQWQPAQLRDIRWTKLLRPRTGNELPLSSGK